MSSATRMKGVTVQRPIVYGTIAQLLKTPIESSGHTHRWMCYVRGAQNEDISQFIRKVVFNLHSSFAKPKRVVDKAPFSLEETGWGEFEIGIRLFFVDPQEKPLDLFHFLRLYPTNGKTQTTKHPIISEQYDEIVFRDPSSQLHAQLFRDTLPQKLTIAPHPRVARHTDTQHFSEKTQLFDCIVAARHKVRDEIQSLLTLIEHQEREATMLDDQIKQYHDQAVDRLTNRENDQTDETSQDPIVVDDDFVQ
mmetsp:Transcript_17531/g.26085  ORF Transcript_17531/g.26085 Transcript_17531/m.26085 type:complete len:250 (-) Transcript_17531:108-857(-)|eukprot:CAMPEP_0201546214 /NCGR_PEP_ID=MMETSP0173_2-20130828/2573_1 /ASSEMBLY_ACC=CAM_ASM_000268 /TAXON_ID=218659 /ORGANISM="Vexillifera sp., Strain DIVA3 564/2" /LENGTH=249 /DNA_ID=CAMNT_0047954821 /DNA_START=46 /DNA_END=795 /DNA_ORIENTATION=+